MNNNIFAQVKKNSFAHFMLPAFMVLSLILQNAAYVQHAFANEVESSETVSVIEAVTPEDTIPPSVVSEPAEVTEVAEVNEQSTFEEKSELASQEREESEDNDKDSDEKGVEPEKHLDTLRIFATGVNTIKPSVTIIATKVICDNETMLPNWGLGGSDVTSHTATDYVASHSGCRVAPDWNFQWGFSGVKDMGGSFVGTADGSKGIGSNTGVGLTDWKTFGPTNTSGSASAVIYELQGTPRIWVREVLKDGYIPFTFDTAHPVNDNAVSAEMYCDTDVHNYDNYDYIANPALGTTYYCVAFNTPKAVVHVNQAPVITVVGANPATTIQDATYVDLGATVFDAEDGVITNKLVASGTVNTHLLGSYTITYNATDSQNLAADTKTRTVTVVAKPTCVATDTCPVNTPPVITVLGINPLEIVQNVVFTDPGATAFDIEDGTITPVSTGTVNTGVVGSYAIIYNATDSQGATATPKTRTVNVVPVVVGNQKPEITLLGDVVMQLVIGTTFTDPSATVADPEDGNITSKLVATGTVNTGVIGSYTITYNATDSQNLAADTKTRTVNIVAAPTTGCTSNCGGSTVFDYPGCTNPSASNYNRLANKDDGSCAGGGGGGGGSVPLAISNEKLEVTGTTTVIITWNTNLPSDSRVVYGMSAVALLGAKPSYGYPLTTATDTTNVYNHSLVINGIPSAIATYYRPVSSISSETVVGIELSRVPVVSSASPASCEYLKEYMRIGVNNNPSEVTKLQLFLKNYDNASNLQVTGFFDTTTDAAVRSFQDKYKKDVLDAWNLPSNTGYVYYTTKKKINEIYCQREFPLSNEQTTEIASFRSLIERINAAPTSAGTEVLPLVGTNNTRGSGSAGSVAGASTVKKTPVTVSVTPVLESTGGGSADYAGLDAQVKSVGAKDEQDPISRGRIAIADLLATAPSNAEDVTTGDAMSENDSIGNENEDESNSGTGVALGTSSKRNLLASVVDSVSTRINQCSPITIYFTLTFLILALIFATLYFRKNVPVQVVASEAPDVK